MIDFTITATQYDAFIKSLNGFKVETKNRFGLIYDPQLDEIHLLPPDFFNSYAQMISDYLSEFTKRFGVITSDKTANEVHSMAHAAVSPAISNLGINPEALWACADYSETATICSQHINILTAKAAPDRESQKQAYLLGMINTQAPVTAVNIIMGIYSNFLLRINGGQKETEKNFLEERFCGPDDEREEYLSAMKQRQSEYFTNKRIMPNCPGVAYLGQYIIDDAVTRVKDRIDLDVMCLMQSGGGAKLVKDYLECAKTAINMVYGKQSKGKPDESHAAEFYAVLKRKFVSKHGAAKLKDFTDLAIKTMKDICNQTGISAQAIYSLEGGKGK